jgi:cytosine/creatinine deaminase
MRLSDYGIAVGKAADLVVWDAARPSDIIATCALPLAGFKRGRPIFTRRLPTLHRPHEGVGTWTAASGVAPALGGAKGL